MHIAIFHRIFLLNLSRYETEKKQIYLSMNFYIFELNVICIYFQPDLTELSSPVCDVFIIALQPKLAVRCIQYCVHATMRIITEREYYFCEYVLGATDELPRSRCRSCTRVIRNNTSWRFNNACDINICIFIYIMIIRIIINPMYPHPGRTLSSVCIKFSEISLRVP